MTSEEIVKELRAGPLSGNPVFEEAADMLERCIEALKYIERADHGQHRNAVLIAWEECGLSEWRRQP